MMIARRRRMRFQNPLTFGGRFAKSMMQFSSFAIRYGSEVSCLAIRFLTRSGIFIGFTSFVVTGLQQKDFYRSRSLFVLHRNISRIIWELSPIRKYILHIFGRAVKAFCFYVILMDHFTYFRHDVRWNTNAI